VTADKKDSQGLCFVGKISLPEFLQQQLKIKQGSIIEVANDTAFLKEYHNIANTIENITQLAQPFLFKESDGVPVGKHQGAHFYTIGQRKGLHIGGRPKPSFVVQTDTTANIVYSGQEDAHLGLNKWALKVDKESIIYTNLNNELKEEVLEEADVRIRYRQSLQKAKLLLFPDGLYVLFDELQRGITPGQFCAWYRNDELIGSGVIQH